jgi:serine/threonine-protein kinase
MGGVQHPPVTLQSAVDGATVSATHDVGDAHARSGATAAPPGADDTWEREQALEREELAGNVLRLQRATIVGMLVWLGFGSMDYLVARHVQPGILPWLAGIRVFGLLYVSGFLWRLSRHPPVTPAGLLAHDISFFTGAGAMISLMCVAFGGFSSPYAAGVSLVLVARAVFMAMPWRLGVWPNVIAGSTFPLILSCSAVFVPEVRAQLSDPTAMVLFALNMAFIIGTAAFSVIGGHTAWSLRRQLFEARSIGRYRLVKRIGRGGMGEVWSALHPGLKRHVAMKILEPLRRRDPVDPVALRRFEREVRATSELEHPNTVRIFDYGVTGDGLWYYTMELLSGMDLSQLVAREGALSISRAVRVVGQAARALGEAHARGIVHRDVKPENLFITQAPEHPDFVKVLDFGIAKLMRDDAETGLTAEGWIGGTPAYMSPEVAAGRTADARADVYALSAVLYFTLTSRAPFEGPNVQAVLSAQLLQQPEPPSTKLGKPLPAELEAFILRNLSKDPERRCQDAAEFGRELAEAFSRMSTSLAAPA